MAAEADAAYCVNVPLGPVESPQDVAAVAAVISSSEASDITGSCIDVNGGIRMQRHRKMVPSLQAVIALPAQNMFG